MASVGPNYIGAYATQSVSPESANDWVNPGYIQSAPNTAYASITAATFDGADISFRIKGTSYGFSIPSGATIDGIVVAVTRYGVVAGDGKDYRVQLLDGSGALVGDNKADTVTAWPQTPTVKSYGGIADKWNAVPTVAMVNSVSFGVALSVTAGNQNSDIYVDCIGITVYYTTGGVQTFYQTVTAVGVGSSGLARISSRYRTLGITGVGTPSLVKKLSVTIVVTGVAQTVVATSKLFSRAIYAVASGIAALSKVSMYSRLVGMSGVGTVTYSRLCNYYRSSGAVATGVLSVKKMTSKSIGVVGTSQVVIASGLVFNRLLAAVGSGVAGLSKVTTFMESINVVGVGTVILAKTSSFFRTLSATASASILTQKVVSKAIAVVGVGAASLSTVGTYSRSISSTAQALVSVAAQKIAGGMVTVTITVTAISSIVVAAVKVLPYSYNKVLRIILGRDH